jgi:beta-glucanase (GH16 family)
MTRLIFIALLILICGAPAPQPYEPARKTPAPWRLVWSDDFDGAGLDKAKWNIATRANTNYDGGTNYYDPAEVSVGGGSLAIRSRPVPGKNGKILYVSGRVSTQNKYAFLYGKIEIRAQMPGGRGLWPALWLLPANGTWPPEIDVAEVIGHEPNRVHMTNHYGTKKDHRASQDSYIGPNFTTGYHTFTFEWEPGLLRWYVDGVKRKVLTTNVPDRAMYLIMNTSVGGDWPGPPTKSTVFPQYMQVDYVRVYQRKW